MKKKGMSTIVANLLVIVAIGIVWIVINNVIKGGTEGVNLNKVNVGLKLSNVEIGSSEVTVTVERTSGSGNLSGISFVVSNGTYSEVFEVSSSLDSLQQGTYTLQGVNVTNIETIEAYPIILSNSGEEVVSSNKFEYEVPYDEVTISGLVSWWRFNGDANDEFGGHDGTVNGDVSFVSGRFGQAASFDGDGDYIRISAFGFVSESKVLTYSFWYKGDKQTTLNTILCDGSQVSCSSGGNFTWIYRQPNYNYFVAQYCNGTRARSELTTVTNALPTLEEGWEHFVLIMDYSNGSLTSYLNGIYNFTDVALYDMIFYDAVRYKYFGTYSGSNNFLNGSLDEFMIFNKSLTEEEIQALYNFREDKVTFT